MKARSIGILETGRPPEQIAPLHGSYPQMFARLLEGRGFTFESWAVLDNVFPESPRAADAWLITGSRHGAYEDHVWIPPLEAFIREAHAAAIPMVGVCFGHQIMAQALGGTVEKFAGGWGLGAARYALDGLGEVAINAVHQDQVTALPPGAVSEGGSAFCEHAAIRYGDHAWSIQPHPEFAAPFLADLLEARKEIFPAQDVAAAIAALDTPLDTAKLAERMAKVLAG